MNVQRQEVLVTTASDGSATVYTDRAVTGRLLTLMYQKTDFADGVDFVITLESTGQALWSELNVNASKTVCPRQPTHDLAGVASVFAAAGEPVEGFVYAANERVKIVIANGGDTKTGTFQILTG